MVCFELEIAYPLQSREDSNLTYLERIHHLSKHYRADPIQSSRNGSFLHLVFAVCNEDASGFLRDLPFPTFCVKIRILRSDTLLYSNYKYTGIYVYPPKLYLLKQVYWQASSLQKYYNAILNPHSFQKVGI
jgi:hypothetical protein